MQSTNITPLVATVNLKLPNFWSDNADAWFAQAEAQFSLRGICMEETHYFYVIAALDNATSIRVTPLLPALPSRNSYSDLNHMQLKTFGQSPNQRECQILSISELGDRLPSELMDTMLCLHGHESPNFLLKFLFKRLLPQPFCHSISSFNESDMRDLAKEADCLMADFEDRAPILAAVRANSPPCLQSMTAAPNDSEHTSPIVAATHQGHFCSCCRNTATPVQAPSFN